MFVPDYPVRDLRGAEYNPRRITSDAEEMLRESIRTLGFCKPVLVNETGVIVAGHQRTTQARALKLETVPAFIVRNLVVAHEMRFNQIHNVADTDGVVAEARVPASAVLGFEEIAPADIEAAPKQPGATLRSEIYPLIQKYGPWGCAIATQSGELLSSQQYAITSKQACEPLRVYRVPDAKRDSAIHYFAKEYGVFSYEHLPRRSYVQGYAQPARPMKGTAAHDKREVSDEVTSQIYDRLRPDLTPADRVLDFGCGWGKVCRELQGKGFRVTALELFYRGSSDTIKVASVHRMIDDVCRELHERGLFDVVICDSVINSVDSLQAEADVLACLNAFCKPGGRILFSGRSRASAEVRPRRTQVDMESHRRKIMFLDADGFSALARGGNWFFQKFHTKDEARALGERYVGKDIKVHADQMSWQIDGRKQIETPEDEARAAIAREFDLEWPEGRRVGRAAQALAAWEKARLKAR